MRNTSKCINRTIFP